MTIDKINVTSTINNTKKLLEEEKDISPAVKISFELMITIISLLVD